MVVHSTRERGRMNGPVSLATIQQPWIKIVVFGRSGVGKTVFSCGSQYFRTFVFDIDDGTVAAKMWPRTRQDQVDVWPVRTKADFDAAFTWFCSNVQSYGLAVVDTATELQQQVIREAAKQLKMPIPDRQAWGMSLQAMEAIATGFHHLPCHVVWTCHETEREDPEQHRVMFRPSFQGAFQTAYAKHFSAILRLCLQDFATNGVDAAGQAVVQYATHRLLHCDGNQTTHAKNRGGALPEWENPDVDTVLGKMIYAAMGQPVVATQAATVTEATQAALPPAA